MDKTCGKCGGAMTVGVNVDHAYASNYPERWQPGAAKAGFWLGLREHKQAQLDVETWRCDPCGFLESYAPDKS